MIAAAIAMLGFAGEAAAQKDAAEKAQEGGIEHWIEYYKAQQPKVASEPARQPVAPTTETNPPAERTGSGAPVGNEALRK